MAESDSEDEALFVGVYPPAAATNTAPPDIFLDTNVYKIALEIFSGKKFSCPNLGVLRTHLTSFVGQPAIAFFKDGSELGKRFNKMKLDTKSSFKSASAKNDVWTKPYLAPRLSLLLSLRHLRMEEKKGEASVTRGKPTALAKAFVDLNKMFQPCYQAYCTNEESESNKKFRTPSLKLNKNTARPHEHFQWNSSKKLLFPCPVCEHVSTMLFQANSDVMGAERVAAAAAISATVDTGCFCFRINCFGQLDGSGCYLCEAMARDNMPPVTNIPGVCKWGCDICACHCSCSFSEPNRMTIALGRRKMKERELKVNKKKSAAENRTEDKQQNTLMSIINNRINGAMREIASDLDDDDNGFELEEEEKEELEKKRKSKAAIMNTALANASLDMLNSHEYYVCHHVP